MKTCPTCHQPKPTSEFYRNKSAPDGLTYQCKDCHGAARNRYMASPAGKVAARRATAAWRTRNPEYRDPRDPQKVRARNMVMLAVMRGEMVRPERCELCWGEPPLQAHHRNGYDDANALNVIWLCVPCHGQAHRTRTTDPHTS